MKRIFLFITLLVMGFSSLKAQKLVVTEVDYKLSKEAAKAKKQGLLATAGTYWDTDKTNLYQIYAFTDKKSDQLMAEIVTLDETGKVSGAETVPFTEENLAKYDLSDYQVANLEAKKDLKGLSVAFVKNPVLAGTPKLFTGTFIDRYQSTQAGSIWVGFKFEKEAEKELKDKFWSFVSFPIGDEVIAKNSHLIAPPSLLGKALSGFGRRQYFSTAGKGYVGGLKATTGGDIYLSGILNMSDGTWDSSHEINIGMKMSPDPESTKYYRHSDGSTSILLRSDISKEYKLLTIDEGGAQLTLSDLANPVTSKTKGRAIQDLPLLEKVGDRLLAVTATYETLNGKTIGLSISPIENHKPVTNWTYSNSDLSSKLVQPAKQKVKFEKLKFFTLQGVRQLPNGDYLINGYSRNDRTNAVERVFLAIQVGADGALKATYLMDAIKLSKGQLFAQKHEATHGPIAPTIKTTKNGFYWIERAVLKGYEKGVHTWNEDKGYATQHNAVRVEDTWAIGQVVKVNVADKSMSNVVIIEDQILGDRIGELSRNDHLALFSGSGLIVLQ